MGAKSRMTAVELVEVTAPASAPRGLSVPRAARSPSGTEPGSPRRRWGRATGRVLVVAVLALAASGIVLANRMEG
ncbi:MAG: hypothetical protein M3Y20_01665, partial [Actinomycetota bacterium]|nr:hypothetical protein [Actinomycetota bacterium]